jgi:hypothetical protein
MTSVYGCPIAQHDDCRNSRLSPRHDQLEGLLIQLGDLFWRNKEQAHSILQPARQRRVDRAGGDRGVARGDRNLVDVGHDVADRI